MKPIYEYLVQDINDESNMLFDYDSRFWIKAESELEIDASNSTLEFSSDGVSWHSASRTTISKGDMMFLCTNYDNSSVTKRRLSSPSAIRYKGVFSAGGDIRGLLFKDYRKETVIPRLALLEAFASSAIRSARDINFSEVREIQAHGCESMFSNCKKLIDTPELPCRSVDVEGYKDMFLSCDNIVNGPSELPLMVITESACESMFFGCIRLIKSPKIRGSRVMNSGLSSMFYGCDSLKEIQLLVDSDVSYSKTYLWTTEVSENGVFVKKKGVKIPKNSVNGIPKGWTIKEI